MQQVNREAFREVETALKRYAEEVERSRLAPSTKRTYLLHADNFVRWLKGDFEPGGTIGNTDPRHQDRL